MCKSNENFFKHFNANFLSVVNSLFMRRFAGFFFMYIFLNMYFLFPGILPVCPLKTHFHCPVDGSGNKACISRAQLCDFTNDCWDGSDEINCQNYTRCDFNDTNICGWLQAKNDQMNWTRHKGNTPSIFTGNLRWQIAWKKCAARRLFFARSSSRVEMAFCAVLAFSSCVPCSPWKLPFLQAVGIFQ